MAKQQTSAKNQQGKTAWVLTREHNDYDQHGAYFVAVFSRKPNHGELATAISGHGCGGGGDVMAAVAFLEHILSGGGRQKWEDVWFNLEEVNFSDKA